MTFPMLTSKGIFLMTYKALFKEAILQQNYGNVSLQALLGIKLSIRLRKDRAKLL